MAKYRMVRSDFWRNPIVSEEMSREDRYFFLYLHTNPNTIQNGIYQITLEQMASQLGFSIENVQSLIKRFTEHYELIRYNAETSELVMKNWGNLPSIGGEPDMDSHHYNIEELNQTACDE